MKAVFIAGALAGCLGVSGAALGQESSLDTDAEMAACAVMDQVTEIMMDQVAADDRWIDNNQPRSSDSQRTYDLFNERVGKRNGVNEMAGRLIEVYNSQCTRNIVLSTRERMCATPTDRMRAYLYDGETCRRHRATRN